MIRKSNPLCPVSQHTKKTQTPVNLLTIIAPTKKNPLKWKKISLANPLKHAETQAEKLDHERKL
jgi:hypothetical protein